MKKTKKQWAIFYRVKNQLFGTVTQLGIPHLSSNSVNLYCDKDKLKKEWKKCQILINNKTEELGDDYIGWLKSDYRGGKLFISRVNSLDFPVTLTEPPRWQSDSNQASLIWALRVPFKIS